MWSAYRDELLAFTRRRLHDDEAAEDLVQDVLMKGYSERERLRDRARLRAWLYQVTRNAIIDHYRRARPAEALPDDLADAGEETAGVEEALARCLVPSLQRLPEAFLSDRLGKVMRNAHLFCPGHIPGVTG